MKGKSYLSSTAEEFARTAHAGQLRINGEPFINHPIRVKKYLEDIGITDENTLSAALLHSVVSHAGISLEEVKNTFGEDIAYLVDLLTNTTETNIPKGMDSEKIPNLHKLFIQLAKDIRVLTIRLADRVDNIKTSDNLKEEEKKWIAKKALTIYAPIAKATGIYAYTREMEDEALRILEPQRYNFIKKFLEQKLKRIDPYVKNLERELTQFLAPHTNGLHISYRTKGIYSTHNKAVYKASKGYIIHDKDFDNLCDLIGVRVLVDDVDCCYKTLAFIQEKWPTIQSEFDDYIANPKPNGYKSLQTAIKLTPDHTCEVQIRTFEMHEFNEYGQASHFAYKYNMGKFNSQKQSLWIKELISMKDNINSSLALDSKIKLFEDTVFVFTPKYDLITLKSGATPIDFAFAVHSDVGLRCVGSKVNKKIVSLDSKLKSGDVVEILTKSNHKPSPRWLEVATSRDAKREIRRSINETSDNRPSHW